MKKTWRSVLTLLLVVVMLFGVAAPTVAYATAGIDGDATSGNSTTQNGGGTASGNTGATPNETLVDFGWLIVDWYEGVDGKEIVATLNPEYESLLDMNREKITEAIETVIEKVKNSVLDELGEEFAGSLDEDLTLDNVWEVVIDKHIAKLLEEENVVPSGYGSYVDFMMLVLDWELAKENGTATETDNPYIADMIDYACELLTLAVHLERFTVEELETKYPPEKINDIVNELFTDKANELLSAEAKEALAEYIDYLLYDEAHSLDENVLAFIKKQAASYLKDIALDYLDNHKIDDVDTEVFNKAITDYIDGELAKYVEDFVDEYFAGSDTLNASVKSHIEAEINNAIDSVVKAYLSGGASEGDVFAEQFIGYVDAEIDNAIVDSLDAYFDHKVNGEPWPAESLGGHFYDVIEAELKLEIQRQIDNAHLVGVVSVDDVLADPDLMQQVWDNVKQTDPNYEGIIEEAKTEFMHEIEAAIYDTTDADGNPAMNADFLAYANEQVKVLYDKLKDDETDDTFDAIIAELVDVAWGQDEFRDELSDAISEAIVDADTIEATLKDILASKTTEDKEAIMGIISDKLDEMTQFDDDPNTTADDEFRDEVFKVVFTALADADYGYSYFESKLLEYSSALTVKYEETLNTLKEESGSTVSTIKELIPYIEAININGEKVFGKFGTSSLKTVSTAAIKQLIKDLPTPTEIAEMTDAEMLLSYDIEIVTTEFGSYSITLTGVVGGGHSKVRLVAGIIADHVTVYVDKDGFYTVDVNVPAKFTELVLRACNTGRISDELKNKVFSALSKNADDVYALYNDITFNDIIDIIKAVDIDALVKSDYLNGYIEKYLPELDLSNLSEDKIIAKLEGYKQYIDLAIEKILSVYTNYVPESYKQMTIMDLYEGADAEGSNFLFEATHSVNVKKWVSKLHETYGPIIASYLDVGDEGVVSASVRLKASFKNLYKVSYSYSYVDGATGETVNYNRVGLLPVGATVSEFAAETFGGKTVKYWIDSNGVKIVTMPAYEAALTPVFDEEFTLEVKPSEGVDAVYDKDTSYNLSVSVSPVLDAHQYSYQWYKLDKDGVGVALEGYTNAAFDVKNVSDSGTYYCVVTVVYPGGDSESVTSSYITVSIAQKEISTENFIWNYSEDLKLVYNGNTQTIELFDGIDENGEYIALPEGIVVSYDGNTGAGNEAENTSYNATATVSVVDDNYVIVAGETEFKQDWIIISQYIDVDLDAIEWSFDGIVYDNNIVYEEGRVYKLRLESTIEGVRFEYVTEKVVLVRAASDYDEDTANETPAGTYITTVTASAVDERQELRGENLSVSLEWTVQPKPVDISGVSWSDGNTSVYDGNDVLASITLSGVSDPLYHELVAYSVDEDGNRTVVDEIVNVGKYEIEAVLYSTNTNYAPSADIGVKEWTVTPAEVNLDEVKWDYDDNKPLIYNEAEQSVNIVGLPDFVTWSYDTENYDGNTQTEADSYVTKLVIEESDNYVLTGSLDYECEWEIETFKIDLDTLRWVNDTVFTYIGKVQGVRLMGIPAKYAGLITLSYENHEATDVGIYTAHVTVSLKDPTNTNYEIIGSVADKDWRISPAVVDISGLTWDYDGTYPYTYNEQAQGVHIVGDIPDYVIYSVENGSAYNAGKYTAKLVVEESDNYSVIGSVADFEWEILRQAVDVSGLRWNYINSLTYNGYEQEIKLSYVPATLTPIYSGNKAADAGEYTASVTFVPKDEANYYVVGSVEDRTWRIAPAVLYAEDFAWNVSDLIYNGKTQGITVDAPFYVVVDYVNASAVNAGEYTASATFPKVSDNYTVIGEIADQAWKIDVRVFDLSGVEWYENFTFTYNGTEQGIELDFSSLGDDEFVEFFKSEFNVVYENNAAINAGMYTASVRIVGDNLNCDIVGYNGFEDQDWVIRKAKYNIDGVTFEDLTVDYTGEQIVFEISGVENLPGGELPEGLSVGYNVASTTFKYMGVYPVTAIFTVADPDNYEEVPSLSATLTITTIYDNEFEYADDEGTVIIKVNAQNGIPTDHDFIVTDNAYIHTGYFLSEEVYGKVISSFDISFVRDGTYMPMTNNSFEVMMIIPDEYVGSTDLRIIYIAEDGSVEEHIATRKTVGGEEYMVFTTTHFSEYAIVNIEDAPVAPTYPDYSWVWIIVVILIILVILVIIILIILKRRKGKDDGEAVFVPDVQPDDGSDAEGILVDSAIEEETVTVEPVAEDEVVVPAENTESEQTIVLDETVTEETVVVPDAEEVPVTKEEPAEPEKPEIVVVLGEPSDDGAAATVDGEVVYVRYRSSFESRLIQAETEIQDYYTVIKNTLLSYKGVKARTSWNYESFNKGRVQCAKLNIKGRALVIYINLNPAEYNINKYHFVDVSDKPKLDGVPMMMKVRSDRALKYTVELIEEMMRKLEIPAIEPQTVDYHMPYETTEELAKRGLVKVILPPGMILDENSNIVKANVGELIDNANANSEKANAASETVEPVVEEPIAEEPVAEEPVVEEPVAEATVAEAPVHEIVHVDATHADELLTDEQAEEAIEVIHTGASLRKGKLCEINLDVICENYEDGEVVNLDSLKAKRLVSKNAARVKVLARGTMMKTLTVIASKFSLQAVKMITLAGGVAEIED